MPWLLLLRSPLAWAGLALVFVSGYAAVQHIGWKSCKADYATFRAQVASLAVEAEARTAAQEALQAMHAEEAVHDLQTRLDAVSVAYKRLQHRPDGSGAVPNLPSTPGSPSAGPRDSGESDADARCLAVIEKADRELSKFAEIWKLQQRNAAAQK